MYQEMAFSCGKRSHMFKERKKQNRVVISRGVAIERNEKKHG
jgi:hypothetical protein